MAHALVRPQYQMLLQESTTWQQRPEAKAGTPEPKFNHRLEVSETVSTCQTTGRTQFCSTAVRDLYTPFKYKTSYSWCLHSEPQSMAHHGTSWFSISLQDSIFFFLLLFVCACGKVTCIDGFASGICEGVCAHWSFQVDGWTLSCAEPVPPSQTQSFPV